MDHRRAGIATTLLIAVAAGCSPSGPVLHVNLVVPMATTTAVGASCGADDLAATGPVSATIPGSTTTVYAITIGEADAMETLGEATVPGTGVVAAPISSDPAFPSACRFTFDLPTSRVSDTYAFTIGDVYLPVPVAPREALESTGWVVDIGVNPQ
jgi:hypothetical protein